MSTIDALSFFDTSITDTEDTIEHPRPTYAATVAHRLTTLFLVLAVLYGAYAIADPLIGEPGRVEFRAEAPRDRARTPPTVVALESKDTTYEILDPTTKDQRLAVAVAVLPVALVIALLLLLRGITASTRDGDPFHRENASRLRRIGGLTIMGSIVVQLVDQVLQDALGGAFIRSPSDPVTAVGLLPADGTLIGVELLYGLGAFVLAGVFDHGGRLRDDVDATI